MGKVLMSGASGGVKSDDVTASKWDVVQGKKTITTDSDDEVVEGTLPEHVVDTPSVNSFMYPQGNTYIMDAPTGVYRREDLGEAGGRLSVPLERLRHDIGYTNVNKVLSDTSIAGQQGAIPFQNAETDGDRAWATIINCGEGQANFGVRNGHYLNGVNHIRGNIPNFFSSNIKKGVNMGGLVGTFEGWVPTPQDLYYNGVNSAGLIGVNEDTESKYYKIEFLSGYIDLNCFRGYVYTNKPISINGYTRLILEGTDIRLYYGRFGNARVAMYMSDRMIGSISPSNDSSIVTNRLVINIDSGIVSNGVVKIYFNGSQASNSISPKSPVSGKITRIRLE